MKTSTKWILTGMLLLTLGLLFACAPAEAPAENAPAPEPAKPEPPKVVNPWAMAAAGDWVEYKMPNDMGQKWTVTEATPDKVVYEMVTTMKGKELSKASQEILLATPAAPAAPEAPGVTPVMGEAELTVGDKTLKCKTVETSVEGKVTKVWTSDEVHLGGLVRTETDGQVMMELVGFGSAAK